MIVFGSWEHSSSEGVASVGEEKDSYVLGLSVAGGQVNTEGPRAWGFQDLYCVAWGMCWFLSSSLVCGEMQSGFSMPGGQAK